MTTRSLSLALATCTTVAALTACNASSSSAPAGRPSPSHAPTASSSPSAMVTPTAPAGTPLGAGERVWAAFSYRGLAHGAWWAQLRPMLSDAARAVYVYDDPRNIPPMRMTGKIRVAAKAPAEPRYTAEVLVPTSKGVFALDLERHTLKAPWLLYAIRFPRGVQ